MLCRTIFDRSRRDSDGEHDWMDPEGGAESVRRLREAGNSHARMYIIKNAGHHGPFLFP